MKDIFPEGSDLCSVRRVPLWARVSPCAWCAEFLWARVSPLGCIAMGQATIHPNALVSTPYNASQSGCGMYDCWVKSMRKGDILFREYQNHGEVHR